ncbi:hypothetical protein [Aquimarina addita]
MKKTIYVLIVLVSSLGYSQIDSLPVRIITKPVDSIQFSIWKMKTKEMSTTGVMEEESETELKRIVLTKKDTELLLAKILNNKSYSNRRALIHHSNIIFEFFSNASIKNTIKISGINGNITIDNEEAEVKFRNGCSDELGDFLIELLSSYKFSNLIDTYGLGSVINDD